MSLDLIICDLDGTLVDSFEDIRDALEVALTAIGVTPTRELLDLSRRGMPLEAYYQRALAKDPTAPAEHQRFAAFVDAYRGHYARQMRQPQIYADVAETLAALRQRHPGLRLAVGTNKRTDIARTVVTRSGLTNLFDLVQGTGGVAQKPDPALLHLIANHLQTPLDRAIMVGDTGADVLAARAAGCRSVAVTYGGWPRHELAELQPTHLIDRFSQLLKVL